MRWEDERYVRVYTRDTTEWISMEWQGRAVFYELCRKVDRTGFMPVGKSGNRGIAGLLRMPIEVVDVGVLGLIEDGCVVRVEGGLLIRNFIEAQEAKQSDVARKRAQRERDRDTKRATADDGHHVTEPEVSAVVVTERDQSGQDVTQRDAGSRTVPEGHAESEQVTAGHGRSRQVTPYRAEPCLPVPESPPLAPAPASPGPYPVPSPSPLGNLATPEVLLAIVAKHPKLRLLRGNDEWAQGAGAITAMKLVRAEDAEAAIEAFLLKKAAQSWVDAGALGEAIGGFLAKAKMHGDDARAAAARSAERATSSRGGPVRGAQPQPGPFQVADKGPIVPVHERPTSLIE